MIINNEEKIKFERTFNILIDYDEECRKNSKQMLKNYKKDGIKIPNYEINCFKKYIFFKLINLFPEKKISKSTEDKYIAEYYIKYKENIYLSRYDNNFSFMLVENMDEKTNIINYENIIYKIDEVYIENEIANIEKSLKKLLKEGLTKEEIANQINNILYKEKENHKQKVKTPQK